MTTIEKLSALRDKIKVAFAEFDVPVAAPLVAAEYFEGTLESGEAIRATPTLAVGSVLSLLSESGDIPAPDGSHKLSDGSTVVVLDGTISEVVLPEAKADEPSPDMVAMSEQLEAVKAENETIKTEFDKYKEATELKFAEIESKITKQVELSNLLNEGFIALAEVPEVKPTQPVRTEAVQMSAQDLVQSQMAKIEAYKKTLKIK